MEVNFRAGVLIRRNQTMKTYYLTSFWKFYSCLSGSILFWFILGALIFPGNHFEFLFLASMLGLADTTRAFSNVPVSHIVVSKNGVVWNSFGFTLSTEWKYIEKISYRTYGFSIQEGLSITKPVIQINNVGIGYLPTPWHMPPVKPFIPLSCFVDNWRDSELGGQIKQYAPHLFAD